MPTAVRAFNRVNGPQSVGTTKAVLLVGGLGTRLRSVVPSTPKPLATLGNKSFLELLIRQLRHQGIHRLVMCTGYLADQIEEQFGDGHAWDVAIEYSREPSPLGTAGAVKFARRYLGDASDFLVMNGDSFVEANFHKLLQYHRVHGGLVTLAVVEVCNACRYGTVQVGHAGRVNAFFEKIGNNAPGLVNAGVYVFSQAVLRHIPEGPASLERTVFPHLLDQGVYALKQDGIFIDIGTPEDYERAQKLCDRLDQVASR
jgi:NDP-sugar pyrophosphorylase family protein